MEHQTERRSATGHSQRSQLLRRGLVLEYITLGWNIAGFVIVGFAAMAARSVALAGFGLDSLIEIFASVVVIWHLTSARGNKERLALQTIGAAFIALAVYIVVQTIFVFVTGGRPARSPAGIAWLTATVIAMLGLARGKLVTGRRLHNAVLIAESRVTVVDAYLAAAVLVGVALNTVTGWWWADPLAGILIAYYALVEGVAHWEEGRSGDA
ncbi:cation transporter [Paraburkholderia sp. SIMBA_053]|uniref:cation transporter n=1 Tax=Paraburkholderia sp. SIMBA_053 TaxID=3085794 RepID=UPI00397E10B8